MRTRITLALVAGLVAPLAAQKPAAPAAPTTATTTTTITPAAAAGPNTGYTYHPDGRRDPFVSLLRREPEVHVGSAGARAAGLAGLASSEVLLKGTLQARDGYVAMLLGADNKTYIVHPGDRLLDGEIKAITADSLVILQQVNAPPSPPTQREVRKMLRQTEEAK